MKQFVAIVIVIVIVLSAGSCEKIFKQENNSIGIIDNDAEMENALTGVYNNLANCFNFPGNHLVQCVNADDINYAYGFNFNTFLFDENGITECDCNSSNYYRFQGFSIEDAQFNLYRRLYITILSANNIISQFKNKELSEKTRNMLGEAYFIRGYCHYRLVRIFGQIPVILDISVNYNLPKLSFAEIYDLIVRDFITASGYLPVSNSVARKPYVTPHRGTAKAFLAEVYLTMGGWPVNDNLKYADAAKIAGEVIDSAVFFGFDLLTDMADLWNSDIRKHEETVFTLYYNSEFQDTYNDDDLANLSMDEGGYTFHYNEKSDTIDKSYFVITSSDPGPKPEIKFFNDFPKSYRKDVTYSTNICFGQIKYGNFTVSPPEIDSAKDVCQYFDTITLCHGVNFRKGKITVQESNVFVNRFLDYILAPENIYLLRYAHILLTYAEAKARSGQLDASAYEAVNKVRRRANFVNINTSSIYDLDPGLTPGQFADSVIQERAWEFAGEIEGRWFDLLRLGMVEELSYLRDPEEPGPPVYPLTQEVYFAPVPQEDGWLNPNFETD